VPEDRLRKLNPENRELANSLRHEMLAAQRAARAQPQPVKKKAQGSTRGSEERQTSVSATAPRGQKRMRDNDLEKVGASDLPARRITITAHQGSRGAEEQDS
jgi:mortality factor 4-like protein 1